MLKPSRVKRLYDLLPEALGPVAARHGFATAEILSRWDVIVGPEIARLASPQKLGLPPRAPAADPTSPPLRATLTLRVEGAFALEIQHRTPEIVERVNAHLGWPCVGTVKIRQGQAAQPTKPSARPAPLPEPTVEEDARVAAATAGVAGEGLVQALTRLGRAALATSRR